MLSVTKRYPLSRSLTVWLSSLQEACDLSLSFQQLPGLLLQLLDLLVRQPSTYLARLMMQQDGTAALEFAQVCCRTLLNS